jgi:hypothetical protein
VAGSTLSLIAATHFSVSSALSRLLFLTVVRISSSNWLVASTPTSAVSSTVSSSSYRSSSIVRPRNSTLKPVPSWVRVFDSPARSRSFQLPLPAVLLPLSVCATGTGVGSACALGDTMTLGFTVVGGVLWVGALVVPDVASGWPKLNVCFSLFFQLLSSAASVVVADAGGESASGWSRPKALAKPVLNLSFHEPFSWLSCVSWSWLSGSLGSCIK